MNTPSEVGGVLARIADGLPRTPDAEGYRRLFTQAANHLLPLAHPPNDLRHVTHEIIRENLDRSPLFSGMIEGTGPRYCPSIEDKVVKFADKNRHQVFIEPEGLNTGSTSQFLIITSHFS